MIIGVDIDGTLTYEHEFLINYGAMYFHKLGKYGIKTIETSQAKDMFGCPLNVALKFYREYAETLAKFPAVPFAGEVLKKLKKEGHQIYIITARKHNDIWFPKHISSRMESFTAEWLLKNEIPFDKIFFNATNKGKVCRDNGVDILIDDDPIYIKSAMNSTNVFVYDRDYNRNPEFSKLTRVYAWYDAYEKIKKFERSQNGQTI